MSLRVLGLSFALVPLVHAPRAGAQTTVPDVEEKIETDQADAKIDAKKAKEKKAVEAKAVAAKKDDAKPADAAKINVDKREVSSVTSPDPGAPATAEAENNRLKTLEGSASPLSVQGNITYSGSTIQHPFASTAANPSNSPQARPVQAVGTISARYRLDKSTTVGLGTGVQIDKPFQSPENFSISDPQVDVAHSFVWEKIHNRVDLLANLYTDHLYHSAGYRTGYSLSDDASYRFACGFTLGFVLELDANSFGGGENQGSQTLYDVATVPYAEYALNKTFNLRSVLSIQNDHIRNQDHFFSFKREGIYQTLGLGIQALDALFLYTFVEFTPFQNFKASNTIVGFNAIVNLF